MPLRARVRYPKIDKEKTRRKVDQAMIKAVVDACTTWVVATTDGVPVYTGGSKASFLKLASKVRVALSIIPRAPSRIPLGYATSTGELLINRGASYGFRWESDLDYIQYVDQWHGFLDKGDAAIKSLQVILPAPVIVRG